MELDSITEREKEGERVTEFLPLGAFWSNCFWFSFFFFSFILTDQTRKSKLVGASFGQES
jgi:hypothetical protein